MSSAKMLLKTGTPSLGHPTPLKGWQFGEEKGRSPTRVIPFGPTVPLKHDGLPPGAPLYGRTSPAQAVLGTLNGCAGMAESAGSAGTTVPGGRKYSDSAPEGPHDAGVPPAAAGAERTLLGFSAARLISPRQVWVFPAFWSCEARRW